MLDSQNLQLLFRHPIKDEVVLETIDTPRANAAKVFAFEPTQPSNERMFAQMFSSAINRLKEANRCARIVLVDALEIAGSVQLGIVADEDFDAAHLRERPF